MYIFIVKKEELLFLDKSIYNTKTNVNKDNKREYESMLSLSFLNYILDYLYKEKDISLIKGPHGKPYIQDKQIFFNLTHSQNILALCVSDYENGIDLEIIKKRSRLDDLAKKVLDTKLFDYYCTLDEQERLNFFIHKWTLKECTVKQSGLGLASMSHVIINEESKSIKASQQDSGFIYSYEFINSEIFNSSFYLSCFTKESNISIFTLKKEELIPLSLAPFSIYKLNS